MYRFWESVIEPLLTKLDPRTLIEIGSDYGPNTQRLLEFCVEHRSVLHVIDPLPKYDVAEWLEEYPDQLVFHRGLSLAVLPTLPSADVVLIDGDHNWFTVINELRLLERTAAEVRKPYPLVMLHDVGWPYGRRDLYYDPDRIPPFERQPYAKAGLRPGRNEPDPDGGLNRHRFNATHEGGPHNGVLTAIEDFIGESDLDLDLVIVPGINDLGILSPVNMSSSAPAAGEFIDTLRAPALTELLRVVEMVRIEWQIESLDLRRDVRRLERADAKRASELASAATREESLTQQRADLERQRRQLSENLDHLKHELARLNETLDGARAENLALERETKQLRAQVTDYETKLFDLRSRYERLRSRRSVRLALSLASVASPVLRQRTGTSEPDTGVGGKTHERADEGAAGMEPPPAAN
jgi:hypothetical protein